MIIKYEKGKITITFKDSIIELTKSEYKNFREDCRSVDMKIWTEEIPAMIREHQRTMKGKR